MLCLRMRRLLGEAGQIRRDSIDEGAARIALSLVDGIVVADMRCALPVADRVLRALAKLGMSSASAAADSLRMPLRTVQAVLQQLVAEGACRIEREGRRILLPGRGHDLHRGDLGVTGAARIRESPPPRPG